jgi:hypothetical protein
MYLIRFGDCAIFVEESRKLSRSGMGRMSIEVASDEAWESLKAKHPYSQCKRIDFFEGSKNHIIPSYAMAYAKSHPDAASNIAARERDSKLAEILEESKKSLS